MRTKISSRCQRVELEHPQPDDLVGSVDAALGEQILDIAVARGELEAGADGMLDDDRTEELAGA